ncbi:C69 family dipeptidase [Halorhodospira sp. 9621]|uniref:C69 family dipeptidase n=1 Tax=Halorhodospira TaxID=85108 RepID=UPI001912A7D1|nr:MULTISPECIES: C69 family dipeptidase [Halorhodospira]MBK5944190.1 hypothetical protein [Halorhodospira halophila]MCG5527691.1 C69 family dipeptidase [Halorhodospira halophila]MCG5534034.1 C69 family dipeptidase [Halorhodospira sp. 9621]MCG5542439.1 C69 family dipeptidase [Halorhodospira sp. 9628]
MPQRLITLAAPALMIGGAASAPTLAGGEASELLAATPATYPKEERGKSVGLYVGHELTEDGSVLLGGYGDEPSSHFIEVIPAQSHEPGATMEVGITDQADIPGERIEIPQASQTNKYIAVRYTSWAGFPPPLVNGGLNEQGLAARDIWSPSREELVEMTPTPQRGLSYSDHAQIAMERAESARGATALVGEMVEEHGHATYGGNSHLFADEDEGWILIQLAGGEGLWAAKRLAPDEVRVSRPGYIGEIPADFQDHPDYMGAEHLISFAEEQGWYDPEQDGAFHFNEVYGTDRQPEQDGMQMRAPAVAEMERWLEAREPVSLSDMKEAVRSPKITSQTAGYGTVAHLRDDLEHHTLQTLWATVAPSSASPFMPHYIGQEDVPVEFKWHRYLSQDEDAQFLPPELFEQEASRYAFREFKRLFHAMGGSLWNAGPAHEKRYEAFYPEVEEALTAYEAARRAEQEQVHAMAGALIASGEPELAETYLTEYSNTQALDALDLVSTMADSIEKRGRLLFGVETYRSDEIYEDLLPYDGWE